MSDKFPSIERRDFLKIAGAAPAIGLVGEARAAAPLHVAVLTTPGHKAAEAAPVAWAVSQLREALVAKGGSLENAAPNALRNATFVIMLDAPSAATVAAEGFRLAPGTVSGLPSIAISAGDVRGFVYAVLELAERVRFGGTLQLAKAEEQRPATKVRSIARLFCDEPHDKPWFYDKDFWRDYLDLMAACRFNRFNLTLGLAYDFPKDVTGDYLHFPYPYLLTVPGYDVHVVPLADGERERNMEAFRFIAAETAKRGLEFQVGIWTHAYQWTDSPHSDHHIVGLTPQNHAAYCRDALAMLLKACPEITGVTLRIHGESGIPEGSYDFWQTVYDAFPTVGRVIEIEMHAKGLNQIMIDMAKKTGMRVKVGPKYSAEHQSLGYHQADIRAFEIPSADRMDTGTFNVSNGDRRFTRYGYADMYQENSGYEILYRLWPGTQHHLLKGDAALAAAMARSASFCGAAGLEIMEPLTFKGREGSSLPGGRNAYADTALNTMHDFAKFEISYRQWGRLLYDTNTPADAWRRSQAKLGAGADAAQDALAYASRILALLTSAHLPSASNHAFWYEIYVNQPILPGPTPFTDTFAPKVFGNVSPLDPQLFSSIYEHVDDVLANRQNAKYSPAEVAAQLDHLTAAAKAALAVAIKRTPARNADFRRLEEDVRIQIGLGEFFAAKLRAGMLFRIWEQTHDAAAGQRSLASYQKARGIWAAMAERAKTVYLPDISYGRPSFRRGHWSDRVAGIDTDIAAMRTALAAPTGVDRSAATAIAAVTAARVRPVIDCSHVAPTTFHAGRELPLTLAAKASDVTAILHYRHVDQAERWTSAPMTRSDTGFHAAIPAAYTGSAFPLQYYFELRRGDAAWLYPAFNASLSNQPYYAVYKRV